jgi:hypothetical protein
MTVALKQPRILWAKVGGLAALQGAVSLMWVVYGLYLPILLTQFGFPVEWTAALLVIESLIAIALEPLMGALSDQTKHWLATRLPFITLGVGLASVLFYAIGAFGALGEALAGVRWILPIMLVLWAIAMTIFRSPAVGMLGRYAIATNLPQANSLLTLVGALAGALGIFAHQFLLGLGAGVAFGIAALVLLLAALVLRLFDPQAMAAKPHPIRTKFPAANQLGLLLAIGAVVGLGVTLARSLLTEIQLFEDWSAIAIVAISHILTVIPAGFLASRIGNRRTITFGLWLGIPCLLALALIPTLGLNMLLAILLGVAFSLVVNGMVPFALSMVPPDWSGLGVGTYFGGAALASFLFGLITPNRSALTPIGVGIASAIAFLLAWGCIAISKPDRDI